MRGTGIGIGMALGKVSRQVPGPLAVFNFGRAPMGAEKGRDLFACADFCIESQARAFGWRKPCTVKPPAFSRVGSPLSLSQGQNLALAHRLFALVVRETLL